MELIVGVDANQMGVERLLRACRERIPTFLSLTFCCAENRLLAV
jgi:hypothetical protein